MISLLHRKVRLAFGTAIFILSLMGALSYRWMVISDESGLRVRHTHDVLDSIQDLNLALEGVESASRGFALTGDETYLEEYGQSVSRAKRDAAAVHALTADNPEQQVHFPLFDTLVAARIQYADLVINLRRSKGMAAAATFVGSGGDEPIKGEFQAIARKMRDEELGLRVQRGERTERDLRLSESILILGTLLGVSVAVIASRSVLAEIKRRQVSEQALRESEEKNRMLLEGVRDYAIIMLDPQGQVVSWSTSAERMKGYTAKEIINRNFSHFFPSEDIERGAPEEVLHVAASGQYEEVRMRVRKDGSQFLASVSYRALRDAGGNLRGFSEICRDLTEHNESEARYRALLEAAPDGMMVVKESGEIILLNAQAEKQFGYRRNELLGQKVTNVIPKGFAERLISDGTRTAAEALAQQIGTGIELVGRRKNKTEFPIEIMLSPLKGLEGTLVTAAIRDITLRKDAEKHLAQMEARYRGLLEAAPDGMVVVNESGTIVLLNAQAEKQFGYRRDELLSHNVQDIIPEGFADRLLADARRTTAEALAQQIGTGIELHGRRKDGTQFPIEIMLSPLESDQGILITAAIRDISERKQLARQLHQSQKMEAVGQLTGGIAHDFNNLLTVILGNLGLLELLVSDNEAAVKRVKTVEKAAARGADITRRLLMFSKNEELKPTFVSLENSIQNTIDMASRGLGLDIKITAQVDKSAPLLFVDPAGLESALLNLVVNARDAMPKGGSIIISSQVKNLNANSPGVRASELREGPYVCVSVTDTGQGMSQETLDRACEPFFTTKPRGKGTGLGLSMLYGFVKQSGGVVSLSSELGHGTTVSFCLPIVEDLSRPVPSVIAKPINAKMGGTVLVVDDESDILEVALTYLAEMGFTTLEAKDGASGLEMISQHAEIDLMVTDIIMAGEMNGEELGRRARALCPGIKIIYSSGFPAEALAERSIPLGDGPLLRKPYQRAEFTAIVHRVMDGGNGRTAELENSHSN